MKFLRSPQSKFLALILLLLGGVILQHNAVAQFSTPLAETEETYPIDAAWNYDGTLLAIATVDSVIIYDLQLTELIRFEPHTEDIRSLNWHPSQNRLLTMGDVTIKIWDFDATLQTVNLETTLTEANADYPLVAAWSPDGSKLAEIWIDHQLTFADDPGILLMRNPTTWELEQQELGPKYIYNPYPLLFWSPDSTHFTVAGRVNSSSSYYVVLDASTLTFGYSQDINATQALVWKNDLAVFEGIAGIDLNYTTPEFLFSDLDFPDGTYALDLNPNADKIIRAGNGYIDIIDVATLTVLVTFRPTVSTSIVRWNPTTDIFVSAGSSYDSQQGVLGNITIWDVSSLPDTSGTPTITPFQSPTPYMTSTPPMPSPIPANTTQLSLDTRIYDLAWHPNGTRLAVAVNEGVRIYTDTLQLITTLTGHTDSVRTVAWSPDGMTLVSGGYYLDHTIRIWDYNSSNDSFSLRTIIDSGFDYHAFYDLVWSPDGSKLATFSEISEGVANAGVGVYDTTTWTRLLGGHSSHMEAIAYQNQLAWNPTSDKIAVIANRSQYSVDVITVPDFELDYRIGVSAIAGFVTWNVFDELVSNDLAIHVYKGQTGERISSLPTNVTTYGMGIWSPDGRILALLENGKVELWNIRTQTKLTEFNSEPRIDAALAWSTLDIIAVGGVAGVLELWDVSNLPDVSGTPTVTPFPAVIPYVTATSTSDVP